ncbi:type 1 glutamine amidotransferase [Natronolimnohabitans innermongolicus]|uniref:type 1 glutamine amidotransferase n=1 Tax=Natronolimnohabitans innermongolicus TaxID=253107 RepID=UPI000677C443|nr:type 1 glutamine amidotransferase [Natronolimnohabitans innermongolicus]
MTEPPTATSGSNGSSELRIALLNAARNRASNRRNFERELEADLVEYYCPDGERPETFAFDGCVITGSWSSVYWDRPWIDALKEWVGEAIDAGLPFLGVCYGHQLLADVLGGRVEAMDDSEIGYRPVEHDGRSRLLTGVDEEFTVFTTHADRVAKAPPGATVFAENDYGIHGFRKDRAFGVQFHPEYDMSTAERVTRGKDDLADERRRSILEGITAENYAAACEAKQLFDNYLEYVREVRTAASDARVETDAAAERGTGTGSAAGSSQRRR